MLLKDIDKKLDMMCTISITQESKWYGMVSRLPGKTHARVYVEPEGAILQLFFFKKSIPRKAASTLLLNKNALEKDELISITEPIQNPDHVSIIRDILDIPSVIISQAYLTGNELNISFRFHASSLANVNALLSSPAMVNSKSQVIFLGPSEGLVSILNRLNAAVPLMIVRFTLRSPVVKENEHIIGDLQDAITEAEVRQILDKGVRLVIYASRRISWSGAISLNEQIYETFEADDPFMLSMEMKCFNAMIPLVGLFGRLTERGLEMTTFLPAVEAVEFINLFYSLANEMKKEKPVLDLYQELSSEMWDWL